MSDEAETANADEGADPTSDIKKQNPGEETAGDIASDDPHKVEKLTKLGHEDDHEAASE